MSDFSTGAAPQTGGPEKISPRLAWLAGAAAIVGAIALFGENVKTVFVNSKDFCEWTHVCAKRPPILPDYVSSRVGGGHTPQEMCGGRLAELQREQPDFKIIPHFDSNENIQKDVWGHVTYQYHCSFTAEPV